MWAQVMIRRKEKNFYLVAMWNWLKKNNRERNNAFVWYYKIYERKLYMKEKPSLKGRVEGWETTEIKQGRWKTREEG